MLDHARKDSPVQPHGRQEVRAEGLHPVVVGQRERAAGLGKGRPGAVHEDVQAAQDPGRLARDQARAVANGKDVLLAGGASIARQALPAGLVDEVVLHIVPKLVGRGVRLFDSAQVDMRCVETVQGEGAVHLRYEVR